MNKFPASLRSDFSDCRFARNKCHFASESMPISSEYTPKWIRGFCAFVMVCVLLTESETMKTEKNRILRRKSMELLKELAQILQEIIGSGEHSLLN